MKESNYILFSCIGTSDPIRGDYDGPMLHIVRHYKPKKVYLFFTKEMNTRIDKYGYAWCIKQINSKCEVKNIITDIDNPNDYSIFIKEFPKCLNDIKEENPNEQLIINISSGTQQMCSALALETIAHEGYIPIQVNNPEQQAGRTKRNFEENKYKEAFENNFDNELVGETDNRCVKPDLLYYRKVIIQAQLIELINNYDYYGALSIVRKEQLFNKEIENQIESINLRLKTKTAKAEALSSYSDLFFCKGNYKKEKICKKLVEYLLLIQHKLLVDNIGDFTLRLEPFFVELMSSYLNIAFGINIEDMLKDKRRDHKVVNRVIDIQKIPINLRIYLESKFKSRIDGKDISIYFLKHIIDFHSKNTNLYKTNKELYDAIEPLFNIIINKKTTRNNVAHTLYDITKNEFQKKDVGYGVSPEQLLKMCWNILNILFKEINLVGAQNIIENTNKMIIELILK